MLDEYPVTNSRIPPTVSRKQYSCQARSYTLIDNCRENLRSTSSSLRLLTNNTYLDSFNYTELGILCVNDPVHLRIFFLPRVKEGLNAGTCNACHDLGTVGTLRRLSHGRHRWAQKKLRRLLDQRSRRAEDDDDLGPQWTTLAHSGNCRHDRLPQELFGQSTHRLKGFFDG